RPGLACPHETDGGTTGARSPARVPPLVWRYACSARSERRRRLFCPPAVAREAPDAWWPHFHHRLGTVVRSHLVHGTVRPSGAGGLERAVDAAARDHCPRDRRVPRGLGPADGPPRASV